MRAVLVVLLPLALLPVAVSAQDRGPHPLDRLLAPLKADLAREQSAKVDELAKQLGADLRENQRQLRDVYTDRQRRAMQSAVAAARKAGKNPREARAAGEAAARLTDDQQQRLAKLQQRRAELRAKAQSEVLALLTPEQRRKLSAAGRRPPRRQPAGPPLKPTHADLKYGPADRNVMDIWLADSDRPAPVLISIHGGGFRGGRKSIQAGLLRQCLDEGITAVAITYRFSDEAIAPAQMMDAARAVQFVRHNAERWKIDPQRIAATGGSAGAGISLWLGFHDDLADPDNQDPVLRQSTRLTCMYVYGGQTSYDPRFIRDMFPDADVYKHPALSQLYDAELNKLDELPQEKYDLFEQISPIDFLTKDDPPAILSYAMAMDARPDIHHPLFGKLLKEKMDQLGIRCEVHAGQEVLGGGPRTSAIDFLKQEFQLD